MTLHPYAIDTTYETIKEDIKREDYNDYSSHIPTSLIILVLGGLIVIVMPFILGFFFRKYTWAKTIVAKLTDSKKNRYFGLLITFISIQILISIILSFAEYVFPYYSKAFALGTPFPIIIYNNNFPTYTLSNFNLLNLLYDAIIFTILYTLLLLTFRFLGKFRIVGRYRVLLIIFLASLLLFLTLYTTLVVYKLNNASYMLMNTYITQNGLYIKD